MSARTRAPRIAVPAVLSVAITGAPSANAYCADRRLYAPNGEAFYAVTVPGNVQRFECYRPLGAITLDGTGNATVAFMDTVGGIAGNLAAGTVLRWSPTAPPGLATSATVLSSILRGLDQIEPTPLLWPRRYYLQKRRLELARENRELAAAWRAKQEALAWPDLPANFPVRAFLMREGYTTVRDLDGATFEELSDLGLTRLEALEVLDAMEPWHMIPTTLKGYNRQDGRFATIYDAPLFPDSVQTAASGHGDTYEMGELKALRLTLSLVAFVGGTSPALTVIIETSHDGVSGWQTAGTFGTLTTAAQTDNNVFPNCDRFVRVTWSVTGSPTSVEFSVTGEAV